jgi:hypothetical protein
MFNPKGPSIHPIPTLNTIPPSTMQGKRKMRATHVIQTRTKRTNVGIHDSYSSHLIYLFPIPSHPISRNKIKSSLNSFLPREEPRTPLIPPLILQSRNSRNSSRAITTSSSQRFCDSRPGTSEGETACADGGAETAGGAAFGGFEAFFYGGELGFESSRHMLVSVYSRKGAR